MEKQAGTDDLGLDFVRFRSSARWVDVGDGDRWTPPDLRWGSTSCSFLFAEEDDYTIVI